MFASLDLEDLAHIFARPDLRGRAPELRAAKYRPVLLRYLRNRPDLGPRYLEHGLLRFTEIVEFLALDASGNEVVAALLAWNAAASVAELSCVYNIALRAGNYTLAQHMLGLDSRLVPRVDIFYGTTVFPPRHLMPNLREHTLRDALWHCVGESELEFGPMVPLSRLYQISAHDLGRLRTRPEPLPTWAEYWEARNSLAALDDRLHYAAYIAVIEGYFIVTGVGEVVEKMRRGHAILGALPIELVMWVFCRGLVRSSDFESALRWMLRLWAVYPEW